MIAAHHDDREKRQADAHGFTRSEGFLEGEIAKSGKEQEAHRRIENADRSQRMAAHQEEPTNGGDAIEQSSDEQGQGGHTIGPVSGLLDQIVAPERQQDDEGQYADGAHG